MIDSIMPIRQVNSLRVYEFESLVSEHLIQAIFTRIGGVSPVPWRSLNVGGSVGDVEGRVIENRKRSFSAVGRDPTSVYDVWQGQSSDVVRAESPRNGKRYLKADAIISNNPDVTLFMRFADCVPILLYDPKNKSIGIAHAGWRETVRGIAMAVVQAMFEAFGTRPEDLLVGVGPSIGPDHYPVGPEVVALVEETFGANADRHLHSVDQTVHFDLWSANRDQLISQRVSQIEMAGVCTTCNTEDWYSHRAESGVTGRFGALIALR